MDDYRLIHRSFVKMFFFLLPKKILKEDLGDGTERHGHGAYQVQF